MKGTTMGAITRRTFLKSSTAAGVTAASWNRILGANDAVRVAVVGFNGRGKSHIAAFGNMQGVRLAALCDADRDVLEREANKQRDAGKSIDCYQDVRKVIENKNIDAISTATPNHWHSLLTIWAVQNGKDVYVEKPVSHNVWEGRKTVEAARKYKRIVQAGTQSRSDGALREALAWVREGNLGKIKVARGLCYKRRDSIGKVDGPQPVPETVDYDLWCGPAPKGPLMRKRLHYDWHWVWPTGSGDLGNQGIHQMDIARWALGKPHVSPRVVSVGGRFGYVDDGETPNTQFVVHDYGDSLLIFEVRGLPAKPGAKEMDRYRGQSIGVIVECENGYLSGTVAYDNDGKEIKRFKEERERNEHFENFIKAVRSRKMADLNAPILEGHLSSALCHTGNVSYRLGRQAGPDEVREALKSDKAACETLERFQAHLAEHKVDLNMTKATLGVFLKMDPKTERFIGNDKANALLTRDYRKPFVVPEKV
ncbi:MAG: dehydrogenase [Acidobacteria bacterium]|nr:MAG: dehydrogenase [Acidobacteriota bacterium]